METTIVIKSKHREVILAYECDVCSDTSQECEGCRGSGYILTEVGKVFIMTFYLFYYKPVVKLATKFSRRWEGYWNV